MGVLLERHSHASRTLALTICYGRSLSVPIASVAERTGTSWLVARRTRRAFYRPARGALNRQVQHRVPTLAANPEGRGRGGNMRNSLTAMAIAAATAGMACAARAESSTIGASITSDREPDKFAIPKNIKYELNASHTFDNGLILAGLIVYTDDAFIPKTSENLEGTLGYRLPLTRLLSVSGSGGVGEHWRHNPDSDFPYYVFRVGADLDINKALTWNIVTFRYRDAFDPDEH